MQSVFGLRGTCPAFTLADMSASVKALTCQSSPKGKPPPKVELHTAGIPLCHHSFAKLWNPNQKPRQKAKKDVGNERRMLIPTEVVLIGRHRQCRADDEMKRN